MQIEPKLMTTGIIIEAGDTRKAGYVYINDMGILETKEASWVEGVSVTYRYNIVSTTEISKRKIEAILDILSSEIR